jgi:phage recombination protein Bet
MIMLRLPTSPLIATMRFFDDYPFELIYPLGHPLSLRVNGVPLFIISESTMSPKKESIYNKFAEKFNFLDEQKLIDTLKATSFKQKDGVVSDEQMTALLIVADQYGLNPFTKEIYAYPDKNGIVPVVGIDGWSRIINQHPEMDGLEFVYSDEIITPNAGKPCSTWIECVIYRKDRSRAVRVKEFLDETYRPPFTSSGNNPYVINGPWQSHTKRLLRHKAMIQCSRIAFGFVGIYDQDEADRIIEGQLASTPEPIDQPPSVEAVKMAPRLIKRAIDTDGWQSALDWTTENFSGANLIYVTAEVNKAKLRHEAALLDNTQKTANKDVKVESKATLQTAATVTPDAPIENKKSPLSDIKANLSRVD